MKKPVLYLKGAVGSSGLKTVATPSAHPMDLPAFDAYERRTWVVMWHGKPIKFVFNTLDNKDNARRAMVKLELKGQDDLRKAQKQFTAEVLNMRSAIRLQCRTKAAAATTAVVKPVTTSNTFVEVTVSIRDASGPDNATIIKLGEFVHADNALDQYKTAVAVVKGLAALAGAQP